MECSLLQFFGINNLPLEINPPDVEVIERYILDFKSINFWLTNKMTTTAHSVNECACLLQKKNLLRMKKMKINTSEIDNIDYYLIYGYSTYCNNMDTLNLNQNYII